MKLELVIRRKPMMIDENLVRLRAHRTNVHRYRRLLATQLSDLERAYIDRHLSEEQSSMEALSRETFPFSLPAARREAVAQLDGCKQTAR
jgi:hypothetical protein